MNKYIKYRREFHKYPEYGWREIRTSARIAEILEGFGYKVLMGCDVVDEETVLDLVRPSKDEIIEISHLAVKQGAKKEYVDITNGWPGVIAVYDTGKEGPITAFRFDIDCLPYEEPPHKGYRPYDEDYISVNKGYVHACGHDAHIAMGLGIADKLMEGNTIKSGKVKLIFQPAEETFYGAQSIVNKGHLNDVERFIALHVALSAENKPLPSNTICCGCKDFLSDRQLDVYFEGKAAHPGGAAQEGKNAILGACTATLNLHAIAPHEEGLMRINVGEISGGVAPNTIAPNAMIKLEYRGENSRISEYAGKRVMEIIEGSAKAYDLKYTIDDYGEVPAGKSDDEMMEIIQKSAEKVKWFKKIYFEGNVGGTDDAAVMIKKVQENGGIGTYVGIGTDTTNPVHNAEFDIDEECISAAIELCVLALREIHN